MKIDKSSIEEIFEQANFQKDDVILYLGGRISDSNLYPPKYKRYLKSKIKKLKPTKIICHNHWYAKKYYEGGILDKKAKIDMVFVYQHYLKSDTKLQVIEPAEYNEPHEWIKILIDKNPNITYSVYLSVENGTHESFVQIDEGLFRDDYDLNNVKYLSFDRRYSPSDLIDTDLGHGEKTRNATDGFSVITNLINFGFKNINILGFTAFGSSEDMSHHTAYNCSDDSRFDGKKHFDISTSEDLRAEADILKHLVQTKRLNNLEDYDKLLFCLEGK